MKTACLLLSCPDKPGIIANISIFLKERNLNIVALEQHSKSKYFFIRVEWEDIGNWENQEAFAKDFKPISELLNAQFRSHFFSKKQTLGLFLSKEPHALLEILAKYELNEFPNLELSFLVSNYAESEKFAKRYNLPFFYIPTSTGSFDHEKSQLEIIKKFKPNFVGLARYMKILSKEFIDLANCPIVNIHHSFLPSFVGAKPYEMAYEKGVKLMGATSHFVIPELDQGPIIEQDVTRIKAGYSVEDLKRIGRDTEKKVFAQALKKVLEHKVIVYEGRTIVFE